MVLLTCHVFRTSINIHIMIDNFVNCLEEYHKTGKRRYFTNEGEIEFYHKNDTKDNVIVITRFFFKNRISKKRNIKTIFNTFIQII